MKISYNWLKTYLPTAYHRTPQELEEVLTDIGLEVEGLEKVEPIPGGLKGIVIGEVVEKHKHPNADRLNVTKVNVGGNELLNIVCGAPNVDKGQKVVVATVGATLYPNEGKPFKIKESELRGELSQGMICAEDEIGLGASHDGIMVLSPDAQIGTPAADFFNIEEDHTIEIGLTPNRADAMSHMGVARDIVAAYNARENKNETLVSTAVASPKKEADLAINIQLENEEKCPRYAGITIADVKVGPSPDWLQNKLRVIGLSPINNVVDITNYILHDLGQPLHAFDYDVTKGNVVVKTLPQDTPFTTLDDVERKLNAEDLMICNAAEGMCIAGVFGGAASGVTEKTQNIFLESAYFNPVSIRKTAKRFGLNTDASFRFERGIDPNITLTALNKAAQLIVEIAGGKIASDIVDIYPNPIQSFNFTFNPEKCRVLAGYPISDESMEAILKALDIKVEKTSALEWALEVPAYRVDVQREADIIEEVLRIYGFNNIPIPAKISLSVAEQRKPEPFNVQEKVSALLSAKGFSEAMNNSLTAEKSLAVLPKGLDGAVKMLNPLSQDLNMLRTDMLVSALDSVRHNFNRQQKTISLFEFGKTYFQKGENKYKEAAHLTLISTGNKGTTEWNQATENGNFYHLKATVLELATACGLANEIYWLEETPENCAYGLTATFRKKPLFTIGEVNPSITKEWDIDQPIFYVDILWDNWVTGQFQQKIKFKELPKFQEVRRDLSLLLDKNTTYQAIAQLAQKQDKKILRQVGLFDVYEGKNLPEGKKSYALHFTFRDDAKTLTDKQVDKVMSKIMQAVQKELGAELR